MISQAVDDTQAPDPSEINIEAHFAVVDAFDMPPVHFDPVRGGFTTSKGKASIAGNASSRAAFLRERWGIIKEVSR
jgi:DNA polymerase epsilon subunit 2